MVSVCRASGDDDEKCHVEEKVENEDDTALRDGWGLTAEGEGVVVPSVGGKPSSMVLRLGRVERGSFSMSTLFSDTGILV